MLVRCSLWFLQYALRAVYRLARAQVNVACVHLLRRPARLPASLSGQIRVVEANPALRGL
jgi:hypothetical protein